jgi:hypothetical protein
MANHVHFTIHIEGIDDEQFNKSVKTEKRTIKDWNDNDMEITELLEIEEQPFMSNVSKEFDEDGDLKDSYDWYCNNVGAKWCHIEEMQDGYISGYSAWRQPHELVINILEFYATKYNTEVSASMTYEDEFRNFMGKQYYGTVEDDGWIAWEGDYSETDGTELMEQFDELYPSLNSSDNDFEWHEEHEVDGETIYPYEVMDELADQFWERA